MKKHNWKFMDRDGKVAITNDIDQAVQFVQLGYWLLTEYCDGPCPECNQLAWYIAAGDDLVPPGCQCPHCGENRVDYLVIVEDDAVRCLTCYNTYHLSTVEVKDGSM